MGVRFPCGICSKVVKKNHKAVQCDTCNLWIHIKCNRIDKFTHESLKDEPEHAWYCISCIKSSLPFSPLNNGELSSVLECKSSGSKDILANNEQKDLLEKLNEFSETPINCK
mgnify:FL=1